MITNAFTCTGSYAILIMLGIKRVENRSVMPVPSKGRCAVSCSKSFNAAEYGEFVRWAARTLPPEDFERIPSWADVKDWPGKVVGTCDYAARQADTATSSKSPYHPSVPWDEGYPYWWNLSEIVCFDHPIPCRGNVGMWQMPSALAGQVTVADWLESRVGERVATLSEAHELFRNAAPLAGGNEGLFVLPLNAERCVLSRPVLVSLGDPSTTVVQPCEVFAEAMMLGAKFIMLAHNHPSGNPTPSAQDRLFTEDVSTLGERLGVKVLDHLVLGVGNKFASAMSRSIVNSSAECGKIG